MNIRYSYTPYCSSWIKFLSAFYLRKLILEWYIDYYESYPLIVHRIPLVLYYADNLYSEYKYNQSLEAELSVEMQGEIHTIKASPSYFNWYTTYNAAGALRLASGRGAVYHGHSLLWSLGVSSLLWSLGKICKLISLKDKYKEYKLIDLDTGTEIASKDMEYLNILDIKYINNPQEVIDHQDEVSYDNNYQVELDNHDIMEMSA